MGWESVQRNVAHFLFPGGNNSYDSSQRFIIDGVRFRFVINGKKIHFFFR